ncbi:hypothetical protein ABTJ55_20080, partial [Acinetobacter baumannii]
DTIEWNAPLQLNDFYTRLALLKEKNKALQYGETFILPSNNDNQIMAYLRRKDEDVVLVLLNVSPDNRIKVAVSHDWLTGIFK